MQLGPIRERWRSWLLVGSLLLNGFLVGILVADFAGSRHRSGNSRIGGFELRRLADRLPDSAADKVEQALAALQPRVQERAARLRSIRQDIGDMAALPRPDRAAIDARLALLRAESASLQEDVQRTIYDAILTLPPGQRAGLAERPK